MSTPDNRPNSQSLIDAAMEEVLAKIYPTSVIDGDYFEVDALSSGHPFMSVHARMLRQYFQGMQVKQTEQEKGFLLDHAGIKTPNRYLEYAVAGIEHIYREVASNPEKFHTISKELESRHRYSRVEIATMFDDAIRARLTVAEEDENKALPIPVIPPHQRAIEPSKTSELSSLKHFFTGRVGIFTPNPSDAVFVLPTKSVHVKAEDMPPPAPQLHLEVTSANTPSKSKNRNRLTGAVWAIEKMLEDRGLRDLFCVCDSQTFGALTPGGEFRRAVVIEVASSAAHATEAQRQQMQAFQTLLRTEMAQLEAHTQTASQSLTK